MKVLGEVGTQVLVDEIKAIKSVTPYLIYGCSHTYKPDGGVNYTDLKKVIIPDINDLNDAIDELRPIDIVITFHGQTFCAEYVCNIQGAIGRAVSGDGKEYASIGINFQIGDYEYNGNYSRNDPSITKNIEVPVTCTKIEDYTPYIVKVDAFAYPFERAIPPINDARTLYFLNRNRPIFLNLFGCIGTNGEDDTNNTIPLTVTTTSYKGLYGVLTLSLVINRNIYYTRYYIDAKDSSNNRIMDGQWIKQTPESETYEEITANDVLAMFE